MNYEVDNNGVLLSLNRETEHLFSPFLFPEIFTSHLEETPQQIGFYFRRETPIYELMFKSYIPL